jgi:hypothetical protein
MLAEVLGRQMAQCAEPDPRGGHPLCAGRAGQIFDAMNDVSDEGGFMYARSLRGGRHLQNFGESACRDPIDRRGDRR